MSVPNEIVAGDLPYRVKLMLRGLECAEQSVASAAFRRRRAVTADGDGGNRASNVRWCLPGISIPQPSLGTQPGHDTSDRRRPRDPGPGGLPGATLPPMRQLVGDLRAMQYDRDGMAPADHGAVLMKWS